MLNYPLSTRMHKFDIYQCDLNPPKWHVQSGVRPCLIVQNNVLNEWWSTCIVIPFTTQRLDTEYVVDLIVPPTDTNWLTQTSKLICNHIITLDKSYIQQKMWVLDTIYQDQIHQKIQIIFDLIDRF